MICKIAQYENQVVQEHCNNKYVSGCDKRFPRLQPLGKFPLLLLCLFNLYGSKSKAAGAYVNVAGTVPDLSRSVACFTSGFQ